VTDSKVSCFQNLCFQAFDKIIT